MAVDKSRTPGRSAPVDAAPGLVSPRSPAPRAARSAHGRRTPRSPGRWGGTGRVTTRASHGQAPDGPAPRGRHRAALRREGGAPSPAARALGLDDPRGGPGGALPALDAALPLRGGRLGRGQGGARPPSEVRRRGPGPSSAGHGRGRRSRPGVRRRPPSAGIAGGAWPMHGPLDAEEVRWSREGDAWVGVLGARGDPGWDAGAIREDAFEVEVLLRAEDWHVEVSHAASGGFERRHVRAADAEEAKARAADLLRAFRAGTEEAAGGGR